MKTPPRPQKLRRFAASALLIAAMAASTAWGQDAGKNTIQQNKADQQDLRQHTTLLAAQVQSLIDELAENGISGDDVKTLTSTKALLTNLSTQEMERVIASLQKASDTSGTTSGERSLVDAYGGQKSIILEFRQILKDSEQRQAADELPAKFKELTDRQTQIMWTTVQDASQIAGKSQQELNTMQQTTAQIVQTDQNALYNDVAMAKQMLDKAAQDGSGDQGRAMQQAQKDFADGNLQSSLDQANADIAAGHLFQATTAQKAARDTLRLVAKDLNPPTTTADALSDFAADLEKVIEEQKDLLAQTNAAVAIKPRVIGLDSRQGLIVDKTNSLQEDMETLSPAIAGQVKDALTPMQLARADLGPRGGLFPKAALSEQDAITRLEAAAQQLSRQVADAQKAAEEDAKDSTQKLQQLQQQIEQAQQAQKQVAQNTTQANDPGALAQAQQQQSQLQQATQQMQQSASPLSLPASQALANAQQAMQQAQQAMSDSAQSGQTQQDQQQAQQALQQADQAIQQAIAQDQQQTADPTQLAQAANQLQQAQGDVSNAQAAAQQQANPSMQQAAQALAQAAQATQAAAATQGLPSSAQAAIQNAQQDITQGRQAAAKGDAKATAGAASAAQASLAQAQAAVAVAQAGMAPGDAPSPPGSGPPGPAMAPAPPGTPAPDGAQTIAGGGNDAGALHGVTGKGKFITVMSRERTAISETQGEPRPQEYSPMIDQYLKNLSDQATSSPAP